MLVRKKRLLVYESAHCLTEELPLPTGIEWAYATKASVAGLFRDDPRRRKTFLKFIDRGYYGLIMYHDAQWVGCCWMSRPDTLGPPHLPPSIQQRQVYWLFYGHITPCYRGRGLYKCALQLQVAHALSEMEHAKVYGDIRPDNVASRKGILSVGFEPKGIIDTLELRIPRVKSWVWGSWNVDADHPRLDGGTSS